MNLKQFEAAVEKAFPKAAIRPKKPVAGRKKFSIYLTKNVYLLTATEHPSSLTADRIARVNTDGQAVPTRVAGGALSEQTWKEICRAIKDNGDELLDGAHESP